MPFSIAANLRRRALIVATSIGLCANPRRAGAAIAIAERPRGDNPLKVIADCSLHSTYGLEAPARKVVDF